MQASELADTYEDMLPIRSSGEDDVFDLTREQLDELPFGVVTLDRQGVILRYNRTEATLASRSADATIGLHFFTDVAPCTNIRAFRGRFDVFAQGDGPGVECFDFPFRFRWGRHDVSITMLRKAGYHEINILVHGKSVGGEKLALSKPGDVDVPPPDLRAGNAQLLGEGGVERLGEPCVYLLGGAQEDDLRRRIHADDLSGVARIVADAAAQRRPYAIEYRTVLPDGSIRVVQETGILTNEPGGAAYAAVVDVTARRQRENDSRRAAHYDELTGLPNLKYFSQQLGDALRNLEGTSRIVAVLVVNVDGFGETNDVFGREIGDLLLNMLAQRLREILPAGDAAARLGLDVFGVLLTALEGDAPATAFAQRLLAAASQPFIIDDLPYQITVRIGSSAAAAGDGDVATLLRSAFTAMTAAKRDGGNRHAWYSSAMSIDAAQKGRRRNELRAAIENGEFMLHYQPIVDIAENRVVGVESLVRWRHPTRGLLPPGEFIDLADETGLIVFLGERILREACRQGREWSDLGFDIRVCVNVSATQFRRSNFCALVQSILEDSGLAPARLEIELTEGVMVEGVHEMVNQLSRLKSLGLRIAIDDFGTGYSSLAYLKYFPVDTLKIDRAFVTHIAADPFDRAIAKSVLTLARELGLDCVAEGIENVEQLDVLNAIGCTIMQGYFFSKPIPPAELAALLRTAAPAAERLVPG